MVEHAVGEGPMTIDAEQGQVVHPDAAVAGEEADSRADLALKHMNNKRYSEAAECLYQILEDKPGSAVIWLRLGETYRLRKLYSQAENAYRTSIKIDPRISETHFSLGHVLTEMLRHEEAIGEYDLVLAKDPEHKKALTKKSFSLLILGKEKEARDIRQRRYAMDPGNTLTALGIAFSYFHENRFPEAWEWFEKRTNKYPVHLNIRHGVEKWEGQSLDGKTILISTEQGIGDTVNFVRYLYELKKMYSCRVVFACRR